MRQTLRTALLGSALAVSALMPVAGAWAQAAPRDTLVALREIDADNYDPARTTSQSAGWAIYMMADTLVSMPAMLVVGAIFVLSVAKEFAGLSKVRRIQLNALILSVLLVVLYLAASPL